MALVPENSFSNAQIQLIESNSIFSKVQSTIFLVIDTELLIRLGENSGMNIFQTFSYRLDAKNLQMY